MEISSRKRCREDMQEADVYQPETKRMRLGFDVVEEVDYSCSSELHFPELLLLSDEPVEVAAVEDLESVIRSFEEEIILAPSAEAQPELGFLLEATDDELGLPAPVVDVDDFGGFEGDLDCFDMFGFCDLADDGGVVENGFADLFGNERSEFVYRPESLPAL